MSSELPTALTRDFGGEFRLIQRLIDKQLDQRGLTDHHEGAFLGGDIVFASWDPREFVLFNLHILYEDRQESADDKYEVLGGCLNQALDMAEFLKRNLYRHMQRILSEAYVSSGGSAKRRFSQAEARDFMEKFCRLRLPRGRLKQQVESEGVISAYQALLEVLRPGFNRVNKSVTKMSAAVQAVDWCIGNLPSENPTALKRAREEIADKLLRARKPESAAVRLLSQALALSESTVRRRLTRKTGGRG